MDKEFLKEVLFPYDEVREYQDTMIRDVYDSIRKGQDIIMHAPTGVGKTASVLGPALAHAIKEDLTVVFLTSRHMQHQIVIKTLKEIKEKFGESFGCCDLVGKKWMCLQGGIDFMNSGDFHQFCKGLKEEEGCEYYSKTKTKMNLATVESKVALDEIKNSSPCSVQQIMDIGEKSGLCPYELAILAGDKSKVIISDYYYFFNDAIRQNFLYKVNKDLGKCILIIDEGHNLPERIRGLLTNKLTSFMIERSLKEAKKFEMSDAIINLNIINDSLISLEKNMVGTNQKLVKRSDFYDQINVKKGFQKVIDELDSVGEEIIEKQKMSSILSIVRFLEHWLVEGDSFSRILKKDIEKNNLTLVLKCLSPEILSREAIGDAYCSVLMSGTLTPTSMYKDILGFSNDVVEKEYQSPFPKENRLVMVVPSATTKYSQRSDLQFQKIAEICGDICKRVKGNSLIFFPSYYLMERVRDYFVKNCDSKVFMEKRSLSKSEKETFIEIFKGEKDAVLLAVSSGNFGEGLDMPGVLKSVIVVGLPLQVPDLEIKELIRYYEERFNQGWDYGYVFPAISKCMQNAGRCIRSEKDRGVMVFLDERYAYSNYYRCFPRDWEVKVTNNYREMVENFFN
tara:strand:- start:20632 stop:22497 length:1866 start_codon:yes stop_codon:yes gene_type:complete